MRRERFSRHQLQRKPLVNDPGMHRGTCVTHVPWCMSGSLTYGGGENVPGIPGACVTRNFTYLVRGPWAEEISWDLILRWISKGCPQLLQSTLVFNRLLRTEMNKCSQILVMFLSYHNMSWCHQLKHISNLHVNKTIRLQVINKHTQNNNAAIQVR